MADFGDNIIEYKRPDKNMRVEVLNYYFSKYNINLDGSILEALANLTKNFSIGRIENRIRNAVSMTGGLEKQSNLQELLAYFKNNIKK